MYYRIHKADLLLVEWRILSKNINTHYSIIFTIFDINLTYESDYFQLLFTQNYSLKQQV